MCRSSGIAIFFALIFWLPALQAISEQPGEGNEQLQSVVTVPVIQSVPSSTNSNIKSIGVASNSNIESISKLEQERDRLWRLLRHTANELQNLTVPAHKHSLLEVFSRAECSNPIETPEQLESRILRQESMEAKKNKGLSVRGGYTSEPLNEPDDEAAGYVELSWDVMHQGYLANQHRSELLEQKSRIVEIEAKQKGHRLDRRCVASRLQLRFVGLEARLLALKLELMKPVYDIERRAYFKGWSLLDELLVSEEDIHTLKQELQYLYRTPYLEKSLFDIRQLPLIDLDMPMILQAISADAQMSQLDELNKALVDSEIQAQKDIRLRLFLRQQFDVGGANQQDSVVGGVRFQIPLQSDSGKYSELKSSYYDSRAKLDTWQRKLRTRTAYQSVREQQQRILKQIYRVNRSQERVRRVFAHQSLGEELQIATAVARVRTWLDSSIELVRAKEELYRRINEIFLVSGISYSDSFIQTVNSESTIAQVRKGQRSIYFWSDDFNKQPNELIFHFLASKQVARVLVSAGKKTDKSKLQAFISQAKKNAVQVELITGDNRWIEPDMHAAAAAGVSITAEKTGFIHLDIEPQALSDYKHRREQYQQQYIAMLKIIRAVSPSTHISISVPYHWSSDTYHQISDYADQIYIMLYGSKKLETLLRRIQPIVTHIPLAKLSIAVRPSDFTDEWEMEKTIDNLIVATNIQRFAFHAFKNYLTMAGALQ